MTDPEITALAERLEESAARFTLGSTAWALSPHECRGAATALRALLAEREAIKETLAYIAKNDIAFLVCPRPVPRGYPGHYGQVAGKVLGYPWFKDDPANFPDANDADGVCIGEHVDDTIVEELAQAYARLLVEREAMRGGGRWSSMPTPKPITPAASCLTHRLEGSTRTLAMTTDTRTTPAPCRGKPPAKPYPPSHRRSRSMADLIMRCRACNAPRSKSPCHKCGGDLFLAHVDWEEPETPDIEAIRSLARQKGYAMGVHGSLERDVDLIAAPWTEDACGPKELAAFIAAGINGRVVAPEEKPLGRWSCNIQIDGWFKLIDLSVAPRAPAPPPVPAITREELVEIIFERVSTEVEVIEGVNTITYSGIEEAADAILARLTPKEPNNGH